jgi:hypothetical protein
MSPTFNVLLISSFPCVSNIDLAPVASIARVAAHVLATSTLNDTLIPVVKDAIVGVAVTA